MARSAAQSARRTGVGGGLTMLRIALPIAAALGLCACAHASYDPDDDSGLAPPPPGSAISNPHAGAEAPSEMVAKMKRPNPEPASPYAVPYIPPSP